MVFSFFFLFKFIAGTVIYGDYLYFAAQWSALMIYDISTPDNPVFQGKVGPTPNHEYCAVVDISDQTAPLVETTIDLTGIAFGIDNHCGIGYAAVGNGLDIIELY